MAAWSASAIAFRCGEGSKVGAAGLCGAAAFAGSAAGFGYMRATELARAIDFLARGIRHTTVAPTAGDIAQILARVGALQGAAREIRARWAAFHTLRTFISLGAVAAAAGAALTFRIVSEEAIRQSVAQVGHSTVS